MLLSSKDRRNPWEILKWNGSYVRWHFEIRFYYFSGLIQDEILYLNRQPDPRERIRIGLLIFEKKARVDSQLMLDNKLIDGLKSAGLNRFGVA